MFERMKLVPLIDAAGRQVGTFDADSGRARITDRAVVEAMRLSTAAVSCRYTVSGDEVVATDASLLLTPRVRIYVEDDGPAVTIAKIQLALPDGSFLETTFSVTTREAELSPTLSIAKYEGSWRLLCEAALERGWRV